MGDATARSDWTHAAPAARPLRALSEGQLHKRLTAAAAAGDGPVGAHRIHELWMRGELGIDIDAALDGLWRTAARSIPEWLPMTYVDWLPEVVMRSRPVSLLLAKVNRTSTSCSSITATGRAVRMGCTWA